MTQTQPGTTTRERTYTWQDPAASAPAIGRLSGLEVFEAIGAGTLPRPPVMDTLGLEPVEFSHGRVVFSLRPQEFHLNPLGTVHGGVLATMLDTGAACAVHTTLPVGVGYTTVDLTCTYLRPVRAGGDELRVVGTVLSRGRRTALGQAQVLDARDRLVAHATSTCLLMSVDGADLG
ncbi:hotdog fold thioesterase [Angustibacter speluncae]